MADERPLKELIHCLHSGCQRRFLKKLVLGPKRPLFEGILSHLIGLLSIQDTDV